MSEINDVFKLVQEAIEREFGEGEKIEDGDTLVFQFNDCVLVMALEDEHLRTEFIGGQVINIDASTGFYN